MPRIMSQKQQQQQQPLPTVASVHVIICSLLLFALSSLGGSAFTPIAFRHLGGGGFSAVQQRSMTSFVSSSSSSSSLSAKKNFDFALLFDCDGVILETEDLHRVAYNDAFKKFELTVNNELVQWDPKYYDMLSNTVGGGKPKMFWHFRNTCGGTFPNHQGNQPAPTTLEEQEALIDAVQTFKTARYKEIVETEAKPRPGLLAVMDQALADPTIAVGVCSASTKSSALKTLDVTLGPDRVAQLDVCILGDDVSSKKPDPLIYNVARQKVSELLGTDLPANKCIVIEDSLIGLQAAKGAGMRCIITYTGGTESQDFYGNGADAKMPNFAERSVTLESIFAPLREQGLEAELLVDKRDPVEIKA